MEKLARKIEKILQEKIFLFQSLIELLKEENEYILNMDINLLWDVTNRKKELALKIENARDELLILLEEESIEFDMGKIGFSLSKLIKSLPVLRETRSDLRRLNIIIDNLKDEIVRMSSESTRYAKEYMMVIDDVICTIVDTAQMDEYGKSGTVLKTKQGNCFINAEV